MNVSVDEFRKNFFQCFIDLSNVLQDLFRCFSFYTYISDDKKERRHSSQISNTLPAHRFINVKDCTLPALKSCRIDDG